MREAVQTEVAIDGAMLFGEVREGEQAGGEQGEQETMTDQKGQATDANKRTS